MNQRSMIILLGCVLVIVVGASLAVLYILPKNDAGAPTATLAPSDGTTAPTTGFNLTVLSRSAYKALDLGPIQSGLLPVQPPTGTGKPNPFF